MPIPSGDVEIAYAVTDDVVVIGSGPAFVKHVLDTTRAPRSRRPTGYKTLAGQVGKGTGCHLRRHRRRSGRCSRRPMSVGDAASLTKYETDVKPYLHPFDALVASVDRPARPQQVHVFIISRQVAGTPPASPTPRAPEESTHTWQSASGSRASARHKQPTYRVVVADGRSARDGRAHRDARPLQPAHRTGRVRRRRRQGEGVARQGRPAVRHGRPPVPQAGILPAAK